MSSMLFSIVHLFSKLLYRYIIIIYPTHLFWQTGKFQMFMICLIWIYSFIYCIPFLTGNAILYNVDNQICQIQLQLSVNKIYSIFCAFLIPVSLIIFIYWKLVRYIKEIHKHVSTSNTLFRAKRELKMVKRLVILIIILIIVCFPYFIMMLMAFFNHAPKNHYRIAYIFFDASVLCVMIVLFQFTDPFKISLRKLFKIQSNRVIPALT